MDAEYIAELIEMEYEVLKSLVWDPMDPNDAGHMFIGYLNALSDLGLIDNECENSWIEKWDKCLENI